MKLIACVWAALALVLVFSVPSSAATKADFQDMASLIESLGQADNATKLLIAIDAIPDDDFDRIYGGVDLTPLAIAVQRTVTRRNAAHDASARVEKQYRDATRAAEQQRRLMIEPRSGVNGAFPDALYPVILPQCPYHLTESKQAPPQYVMDTTVNVQLAGQVLEQVTIAFEVAKGIWDGLSRGCEQVEGAVILGEGVVFNLSLACIPVDIVFAVADALLKEAEFGVELAKSQLDIIDQCDGISSDATTFGTYDRTAHIHADMDTMKDDIDVKLELLQGDVDMVKRMLLEAALTARGTARMSVNYVDLIDDVCALSQLAIDDAIAANYDIGTEPQLAHDLGQQLIPTDPKTAHDMCRTAYRMAALGHRMLPH